MKKILFAILGLFYMLAFLPACSDDDSSNNIGESSARASVISSFETTNYDLPEPQEGVNPYLFRMNWTKTKFFSESGDPVFVESITYEVEADLVDNNFSNPVILATTEELYTDIYIETLRKLFNDLVGEDNEETQTVSVRVKATGNNTVVYSASSLLVITPFVAVKEPPYIFIIGDMNGWDPNNTDYILFRNDNDVNSGVYTYTGNFGAGCWLKFCGEEYLGGYDNMYCAGENGVLDFGDKGAFFIEGYATVTIDIINMTWQIMPYDASGTGTYATIGPIGEFCDWGNEPPMTVSSYDAHQWNGTFTFDNTTTVKFRGDQDWGKNWGAQPTDLPFGHGIFDGPGATTPAGTYRIYLNDLTGHYVIKKQAE